MTTDNGSSLSQANVHLNVQQQIVKADADLVNETLNNQFVAWIMGFNFPAGTPHPKIERDFPKTYDETARAQSFATLASMGYVPTLKKVQQDFEVLKKLPRHKLAIGTRLRLQKTKKKNLS